MGALQLTYEPKFKIVHRSRELMRSHEAKSVQLWLSTDPLAEKFPDRSPYEYCYSNPINVIDPTGMEGEGVEHDYKYGKDGKITLPESGINNSKTDRLIAENGDVIADNIDKRILKDNINIAKDGLLIENLDKNKDLSLNGKVGNLMTRISIYEQKEISWGFYGEDKSNKGTIVIGSYATNDSETSEAPTRTYGSGNSLLVGNHTHPSLSDNNSYPSRADMRNSNNGAINFIWANNGVSQYNSTGKVPQRGGSDLVRDYTKEKMKSTYNINFLKNVLKWKKNF